jgi:hypothetical protein
MALISARLPTELEKYIYEDLLDWRSRYQLARTKKRTFNQLKSVKLLVTLSMNGIDMDFYKFGYDDNKQNLIKSFFSKSVVNLSLEPTEETCALKIDNLYSIIKTLKSLNQVQVALVLLKLIYTIF